MGLIRYLAKEAVKEMGNKSREFYEFVLPPVDMHLNDNTLTVVIDIPGFEKKDIKLKMQGNILSINAKKNVDQLNDTVVWRQRPSIIDKKIRLPIRIKEGEETVNSAKYSDGVLTIKFPISNGGKQISID